MRLLLALLAVLGLSLGAHAQTPVSVTGSTPANGSVGVGLMTTLSFTFSVPIAEPPSVFFSPNEAIVVGDAVLAPDGLSVSYAVEHLPDTRYVVLMLGVNGVDGGALAQPFALNYTTAGSTGSFTVSGDVNAPSSPEGAIAALGTVDLGTGDFQLIYADVVGPSGAYSLGPVPFGVYFAGAVQLPDEERPFAFGFYDPDGDGVPNPVIVPFNVDIDIAPPAPVTAGARVEGATEAAAGEAPDNELVLVPTTPIDLLGTSPLWSFNYYSASQGTETTVLATGFLPLPFTQEAPDGPAGDAPIVVPFVDTDAAVQTAEDGGGRAFRDQYPDAPLVLTIRGGLLDDFPAMEPFWRIDYRVLETDEGPVVDSLGVFVDMATGALLGTTTTANVPTSSRPRTALLNAAFPNPFTNGIQATVTLDAPSRLRAVVFDALGREVAVLTDGHWPAGPGRLHWTPRPGTASGVYVLHVTAGETVESRRLVYRAR